MTAAKMGGEMAFSQVRPVPGNGGEAVGGQLMPAARDFRFLLSRGYPRQAALTLVGNRYNLAGEARQILHRGVFSPAATAARRGKLCPVAQLAGRPLAVDGHNVIITLECAHQGLPLVAADDGFIRDIGRLSRSYRPSDLSARVVRSLCGFLSSHGVGPVFFWYDAPMSRSGQLAAMTREVMAACRLAGEARTAPVPEKHLLAFDGAVAGSDTYIIDLSHLVADAAGEIIRQLPQVRIISLEENV